MPHPNNANPAPPRADLMRSWLRVSLQSFGGGTATLALIRREFVTRRTLLTEEQFRRDWSLSQLAPGINLIAMAVLIGRRTGGFAAILIAVLGLVVPSFVVTLALTIVYSRFMNTAAIANAMKGVVPAVAGIGFATAFGMGKSIASDLWSKDKVEMAVYAALLAGCLLATVFWHPPLIIVLLGGGAFGAIFNSIWQRLRGEEE